MAWEELKTSTAFAPTADSRQSSHWKTYCRADRNRRAVASRDGHASSNSAQRNLRRLDGRESSVPQASYSPKSPSTEIAARPNSLRLFARQFQSVPEPG